MGVRFGPEASDPNRTLMNARTLLCLTLVTASGCSFVFSDAKYIDNDAEIPFDTGAGDADGGDGGDAGDATMDGDAGDGGTGCVVDPSLCTEGTRCAADGRCVACDADGDGTYAPDSTCDAMAGDAARDCDDDDGDIYPGAPPVCGDGKINGCDAGPESFRTALSVGEIGALGVERITPMVTGDDLSSLALDVTADTGAVAPVVVMAWATESNGGRFLAADPNDLSRLSAFGIGIDTVAVDLRSISDTGAVIRALRQGTTAGVELTTIAFSATDPTTLGTPAGYAFDDGPCASAAEAGDIASNLVVDATGAAVWLLGGSARGVHVTDADVVSCFTMPAGAYRLAGTTSEVVGAAAPVDGSFRAIRAADDAVDAIASGAGPSRVEAPGFAFVRAATHDLHLGALVGEDGRTRTVPVECTPGGACAPSPMAGGVFDAATGVSDTYGAALDALTGDHLALVQIEERGSAPAPDDQSHEVVLRLLSYPATAVGGDGASGPGESLLLHRHSFASADRDHSEVREVEVASLRDASSGDLSLYWAARIGDRRLAPGSTDDPSADNEIRYGGVRFCVSE